MIKECRNPILIEFIEEYFTLVNADIRIIFEKYFNTSATYEEIGIFFDCRRQAIQDRISRNIKNMRSMLEGRTYKKKNASIEIIKIKSEVENALKNKLFYSESDLFKLFGLDYKNNLYYIKIFLTTVDINIYEENEDIIFSHKKYTKKNFSILYRTIVKLLNEHVTGIDNFFLVANIKKKIRKVTNEEIISLCQAMSVVEKKENKYKLRLNNLSSYDKKALRILDENQKPMSGRDIAIKIFNKSNELYDDEKIKGVINSMTNNEFIESVGKTGLWILNSWEYESGYHLDVIKKVFQNENRELSSREIYAIVCSQRPDLSLEKIQSYLYSKSEVFTRIGSDLFIINPWIKRFNEEVNEYKKTININKRFNVILYTILKDHNELNIKQLTKKMNEKGVTLSESRIRAKLDDISFISYKEKKGKYFYYLSDKRNANREFLDQIMKVFKEAKNGIENRNAHVILKDGGEQPKDESSVQIALYEMTRGYFAREDIDVTREAWTGRGPVDFKFSKGFNMRILFELKLASNPRLYEGLDPQLVQYMASEGTKYGIFIVVLFKDEEFTKITEIEKKLKEIEIKYNMIISFECFDARGGKPSPSKLKKGEENVPIDLIVDC